MILEVYQQDWMPGFAAFLDDGSMQKEAKAAIVLNLGGIIATVATGDVDKKDVPYFVAESIMHEVIHAIEAWADVEFSEERVDELLEKYAEKYGAK